MTIYWLMLAVPLLATLSPGNIGRDVKVLGLFLAFVALVLIIGLRDEIGCDWEPYEIHYLRGEQESLAEGIQRMEAGYGLINWVSAQLGLGVYAVNTACAAIFAFGLLAFCRRQPLPSLALAAAIPYMVIVVAMGYTRQAAALGVVMLSFNAFADRRPRRFLILLGVATLFHTSAVALAPMVLFIGSGKQLSRRAAALVGAGSLILLGGLESLDRYLYSYIEREYEGEGIFYRLPLDLLAAALFFFFRKRWAVRYNDNPLNAVFSLMSLALIPLIFVSTVIADRVGLYLLPFQAAVFSRVPHALARSPLGAPAFLGVAASLAAMLYIWLNYANHAMCWVPYNSLLG